MVGLLSPFSPTAIRNKPRGLLSRDVIRHPSSLLSPFFWFLNVSPEDTYPSIPFPTSQQ